jgi:hypothetical protein
MSYESRSDFAEYIEVFQARETPIPQEVLDIVKKECGNDVPNVYDVKRILRRNGKSSYMEQANKIIYRLYGVPLPKLSDADIERLKQRHEELNNM